MTHQGALGVVGMTAEIHERVLFSGCTRTFEKELL